MTEEQEATRSTGDVISMQLRASNHIIHQNLNSTSLFIIYTNTTTTKNILLFL